MESPITVIGVLANHNAAESAVNELAKAGIDMKNLSVVGKGYHSDEKVVGCSAAGDRSRRARSARRGALQHGRTEGQRDPLETAVKADSFLVMAYATAGEVARARTILEATKPSRIDVQSGVKRQAPASQPARAAG